MKTKVVLLLLIFNFSSAMCADRYEKEAADSSVYQSCDHAYDSFDFCFLCGSLKNGSQFSGVRPPAFVPSAPPREDDSSNLFNCVHGKHAINCFACALAESAADSDKRVHIEQTQCQQHIYEKGYCIHCKQPGQYERDVQTSNGIGGGGAGGDENITSSPNYKNYIVAGGMVIALAYYLWKKFR